VGLTSTQWRSYGRTVSSILLTAAAVFLSVAVWSLADATAANSDNQAKWVYLTRMTYLMTGLLLVTLAVIALRCVRWVSRRLRTPSNAKPTSLESAWEEAGRRFKLPPEDQVDDPEHSSEA